jgi:hypothetical protein
MTDNVNLWSSSIQYNIGDVVFVGDVSYTAVKASINVCPPNLIYWVAA